MNVNKLKAKFVEHGMTQNDVAKSIGIANNSLSRKLAGKSEFTLGEVVRLCRVLEIAEPTEIFFSQDVS